MKHDASLTPSTKQFESDTCQLMMKRLAISDGQSIQFVVQCSCHDECNLCGSSVINTICRRLPIK